MRWRLRKSARWRSWAGATGSSQESSWPVANSENLSKFLGLSSELYHEARDEGGTRRGS